MFTVKELTARREAFCKAAANGKLADVDRRLRDGHDPNALVAHSRSALQMAAHRGRTEVCESLLAAKADVSHSDVHGWTALHDAAAHGRASGLVLILLRAGADKAAKTRKGAIALEMARQQGKSALASADFLEHWDLQRDLAEAAAKLGFDSKAEPHLMYVARELVLGMLPDGWLELSPALGHEAGARHFQNLLSGETSSEHPLLEAMRLEVGMARKRHSDTQKAAGHRLRVTYGDVIRRWRAFYRRSRDAKRKQRKLLSSGFCENLKPN